MNAISPQYRRQHSRTPMMIALEPRLLFDGAAAVTIVDAAHQSVHPTTAPHGPDPLAEAIATLNERERAILIERRLTDEPKTLEELSQTYNVSRERVRQIEVRAFEKLQKAMQDIASARHLLPAA